MNSLSKTTETNDFADLIGQKAEALSGIAASIYAHSCELANAGKTQETIETEIEKFQATLYHAILHEKNEDTGKPKYSNDDQRKTALKLQENLAEPLKKLKTERLNRIEAQANLKALIELERKNFRAAELNLLFLANR